MKPSFHTVFFLILGTGFFAGAHCGPARAPAGAPEARKGILDLRSFDFARHGPLPLAGDWEFFPRRLLGSGEFDAPGPTTALATQRIFTPTGLWNRFKLDPDSNAPGQTLSGMGVGTFRLRIVLPPRDSGDELYAVKMLHLESAYALFADTRPVSSAGRIGPTAATTRSAYRPGVTLIPVHADQLELVLQIANFQHVQGGVRYPIWFGPADAVLAMYTRQVAFELFLCGALCIMGLYHIGLFVIRRPGFAPHYFGGFCFMTVLRLLVTGERIALLYFPEFDFTWMLRIENITAWLSLFCWVMYVSSVIPQEFPKKLALIYAVPSLIYPLIILFTPVPFFSGLSDHRWLLIVVGGIHLSGAGLVAAYRRRANTTMFLVGYLVVYLATVHDVLDIKGIIHTDFVALPSGIFLFIFIQAFFLTQRFAHALHTSEKLSSRLELEVEERTRELRDAYRDLQAQDEARTTFFTNISHEIRTPLTLLLSPIETMSAAAKGEPLDEATRTRLLAVMRKNGRNLLKLVNDLLDLSRLEAGRARFEPRPVHLIHLVREVTANFEQAARQSKLRLEFVNLSGGDVTALMDAEKLEKILFNLLGNALKFTPVGGVTVSVQADTSHITIRVADTGVGIPAEQHELIFERFRQADSSDARRFEGTGIGLYIVRRFTELHGGTVHLRSAPGQGSTFTLLFPRRAAPSPVNTPLTAISPVTAGVVPDTDETIFEDEIAVEKTADVERPGRVLTDETVLLVEDNPDLLEFLRTAFAKQYHILTARDGRAGLDLARRHRPDLIITDIMMPHVSGLDLLKAVRADAHLAETPVVLLTARASIEDRLRGLGLSADDYLDKPFYIRELMLRVRSQLYRKRLRELAVARESQRIYADFHDHLGARLTDLTVQTRRMQSGDTLSAAAVGELHTALQELMATFRDCLTASDDLKLLHENFADGLHMILLRRYVNAGRELRFFIEAGARRLLGTWRDDAARAILHAACTELSTNDIRYGTGATEWRISFDNASLLLSMHALSHYDATRPPGRGAANVRSRLAEMGGQFEATLMDGEYRATLRLPLSE